MKSAWISGKLRRPGAEQELRDVQLRFDRNVSDDARDAFLEGIERAGVPEHPDFESATAQNLREVLEQRYEESRRHE